VYLPDPKAAILFTGYQAPGSLGRRIQEGAKDVMIDGERVSVHASTSSLTGYSGHKDRDELLSFAESAGESLKKVFVVMGEPKASMFLAQRIKDFLGITSVVPHERDSAEIEF
jgi:metallo-beta-lactamase family protein